MLQRSLRHTGHVSPFQQKGIDERLDLPVQDLVDIGGLQPRSVTLHELVRGEDGGAKCTAPIEEVVDSGMTHTIKKMVDR